MRWIRNAARHGSAIIQELCGAEQRFCIRGAYRHRTAPPLFFDDTPFKDEYQREVYERGATLAKETGAQTVFDVGCGSGFKLVKYLGDYDTTGFELPQTVAFLRSTYPNRRWLGLSDGNQPPADLVICSDVIEHVTNPDELMTLLLSLTKRWLVISTPDRRRSYSRWSPYELGPPASEHHVREWSFSEFGRYVSQNAKVIEHRHANPIHATQMIVARTDRA